MNEIIPQASISEVTMSWLLVTAAAAVLFSLFEAWLATLIIYVKVAALKKLFPSPHNLIKSHVDYLLMAALLGTVYFSCLHLGIALPKYIIVILCIGAIYNPFGFILKAMNPGAGSVDSVLGKIALCVGFLPATIGFGYSMIAILGRLV
ncbi:MAG: hypothetical protein HOC23_20080 [Halieaceae bacterium]|jgi:hypothetical protein|nr:hypothetical protein [Halieaceae bacterium]